MCKKNNQNGFSYLEVIVSILLLTIGIMAVLASISMAMLRAQIGESKNTARQLNSSALESIFAVRDLRNNNSLNNWDAVNNAGTLSGVFLTGWRPIRFDSGVDGINGTADDACNSGVACPGTGGFTNISPEILGFQRRIIITNLPEPGIPEIRKKRIDISVRYQMGQIQLVENSSTIITNLPFN